MCRQHQLLRRHALGNFRDLMQEITIDPAMLWWLDGDGSTAESPNENYAREVDGAVHARSRQATPRPMCVPARWRSPGGGSTRPAKARYDEATGPQRAVDLLGRSVSSAAEAIDTLCDHPACAPFIAGKVHAALTGAPPGEGRRAELAAVFAGSGLDIGALVEAIVTHESFLDRSAPRPRTPVEWWVAMRHLYAMDIEPWALEGLGQLPFYPPNVAGWPGNDRWISAGSTFAKAQLAMDAAWDVGTLADDDPAGEVLQRAGIVEVSDATRALLDDAASAVEGRRDRATVLHALVAMTPEFSLA